MVLRNGQEVGNRVSGGQLLSTIAKESNTITASSRCGELWENGKVKLAIVDLLISRRQLGHTCG